MERRMMRSLFLAWLALQWGSTAAFAAQNSLTDVAISPPAAGAPTAIANHGFDPVLEQSNILRNVLSLVPLTAVQLAEIEEFHPRAAEAARIHAADLFLRRIKNQGQSVARGLPTWRLQLMAQRILRGTSSEHQAQIGRLVEKIAPSGLGHQTEGELDAERVAAVLDDFFSGSREKSREQVGAEAVKGETSKRFARLSPAQVRKTSEQAPPVEARNTEPSDLFSRTKKIAILQRLFKNDPAAALQKAQEFLSDLHEQRLEVRITALRAMETASPQEAAPILTAVLKNDGSWYLRREAARILGGMAARVPEQAGPETVSALQTAFSGQNESLRLMAKSALEKFGADPGPEPVKLLLEKAERSRTVGERMSDFWKKHKPLAGKAIFAGSILWVLGLLGSIAWGIYKEKYLHIVGDPKATPEFIVYIIWTAFVPAGLFILGCIIAAGYQTMREWGAKDVTTSVERPATKFSDVVGIDDASVEMREVMDFLKAPAKYRKIGGKLPKGVLLVGPPGTGKTLMAKALAGETNASYLSVSGSDFVEMYVGVGAARVRELFKKAREHAPAIIFIDEIDAVGTQRSGGVSGGEREHAQTLVALLNAMDGFDNSNGVIIVAATNRPDVLDAALKRPGRFDRTIYVGLPDSLGREAILALHAAKVRLGPDVDLQLIAKRTQGLSGAFMENIVNEAAMLASRRGADAILMEDVVEASDRISVGAKRGFFMSDEEKRETAYHEIGHALVELVLGGKIDKITIVPHGSDSLGHTRSASEEDRHGMKRKELENRMAISMGGLVAEEMILKDSSTGPGSDLEQATKTARYMVEKLGMGKRSGWEVHGLGGNAAGPRSPELLREIELDVRDLLDQAHDRALVVLHENRQSLESLTQALLAEETLTGDQAVAILEAQKTEPRK